MGFAISRQARAKRQIDQAAASHSADDQAATERHLLKAAKMGSLRAMYNLGVLYANKDDMPAANKWWLQTVDSDSSYWRAAAQYELGTMASQLGNAIEAESLWAKSATAGYGPAATQMGDLLRERGDLATAAEWYREAAEQEDANGANNYAVCLEQAGDGAESEKWYRKAAELGSGEAMYVLGKRAERKGREAAGDTAEVFLREAEKWYRLAAEKGDPWAFMALGLLATEVHDVDEAQVWFDKLAAAGNPEALSDAGMHLEKRDQTDLARQMFTLAAAAGSTEAMCQLGVLDYLARDLAKAEKWWRAAAELDHPRAAGNLAVLLEDEAESLHWLKRAAELGYQPAVEELGGEG